MKIEIPLNLDAFKNEVCKYVSAVVEENIVSRVVDELCENEFLRDTIISFSNSLLTNQFELDLKNSIERAIAHVEFKHKSRIEFLESRLESVCRNLDYLFNVNKNDP